MMTAFHILESRLLLEIYNIRLALSQIQHPNYNHLQHNQFLFPRVNLNPTLYHSIVPAPRTSAPKDPQNNSNSTNLTVANPIVNGSTSESSSTAWPITQSTTESVAPIVQSVTTTETVATTTTRSNAFPFLKSLPVSRRTVGPRDFEIYKFNNTILSGNEVQVFTYFWKIENYTARLMAAVEINSTDIYSPAFVISGFNLRIKASLNHLNRDYLHLRLEETPKNYTGSSSVILETGDDLFHEIETHTMFRYKIIVLDQSPKKSDLISQEFSDTTSGFMIPSSALTSTLDTYIKDDLILIKVILYL